MPFARGKQGFFVLKCKERETTKQKKQTNNK